MPRRTVKGSGKKSPLNMRTTQALRKKLEMAAGLSGRSLVQEVEFRLEQSFAREDFGKLHISTLMWRVYDCCVLIEAYTGKNCFADDARSLLVAVAELVCSNASGREQPRPGLPAGSRGGSGGRWPTCDG